MQDVTADMDGDLTINAKEKEQKVLGASILEWMNSYSSSSDRGGKKRGRGYTRAFKDTPKHALLRSKYNRRINRRQKNQKNKPKRRFK